MRKNWELLRSWRRGAWRSRTLRAVFSHSAPAIRAVLDFTPLMFRANTTSAVPLVDPRKNPHKNKHICSISWTRPCTGRFAPELAWKTWYLAGICLSRASISRSMYFMYWKSTFQPNLPRHSPPGVSKISLVLIIYIQYDVGSDKPVHKETAGDRDQHRAIPVGRSLTIYLRLHLIF